jgi:hypothetical protein
MTSLPASTFSLVQHGEIRTGFVADLVIFELAAVQASPWFGAPHHYAGGRPRCVAYRSGFRRRWAFELFFRWIKQTERFYFGCQIYQKPCLSR